MSILEEATISTVMPMMAVFNNLVMFDPHVAQNSSETIIPDLATNWYWSDDGTQLTFELWHDVKWHDGRPFTVQDVRCTWYLLASGNCFASSAFKSAINGNVAGRNDGGLEKFPVFQRETM
jgi:ABC-type transport system substrate-binding protein